MEFLRTVSLLTLAPMNQWKRFKTGDTFWQGTFFSRNISCVDVVVDVCTVMYCHSWLKFETRFVHHWYPTIESLSVVDMLREFETCVTSVLCPNYQRTSERTKIGPSSSLILSLLFFRVASKAVVVVVVGHCKKRQARQQTLASRLVVVAKRDLFSLSISFYITPLSFYCINHAKRWSRSVQSRRQQTL